MSSPLPLIILGQVCLPSCLLRPIANCGLNSTPSIVVTAQSDRTSVQPVPEPEFRRNDYTYTPNIGAHKVHTQVASWNLARKICLAEGGHLAIINSRAESELLTRLVANSGSHFGSSDSNYVHIGFHDLFQEGEFVTVSGEPIETVGFNEWYLGHPNNDWNEDCGSIHRDGKLNDIGCGRALGFVCELPH